MINRMMTLRAKYPNPVAKKERKAPTHTSIVMNMTENMW